MLTAGSARVVQERLQMKIIQPKQLISTFWRTIFLCAYKSIHETDEIKANNRVSYTHAQIKFVST